MMGAMIGPDLVIGLGGFGETIPEALRDLADGLDEHGYSLDENRVFMAVSWERAYIERVIGSIRRECLDHVIVFNEASLYGTSSLSWSAITRAGRTFRWKRTLRVVDRCNLRGLGE